MLKKVEAVIVKAIKYSETSIICNAYTNELGLRTYIINGVRKKNSRISPALLQPMALVDLVVYHNEDKDVNRIKEIKPSYIYQRIPFEVAYGAIGLFMTEVVQKTLREPESQPHVFEFLKQCYVQLDQTATKIANYPIWFLAHFAAYLGLSPNIESLTDESVFDYSIGRILAEAPSGHHYYFSTHNTHLLAAFLELDVVGSAELDLSKEDRRSLQQDLLHYYQYHLDNFGTLNSIAILQSVFA
ncbi:MAG: DNA repair protein RecO [Aureispira sp.]